MRLALLTTIAFTVAVLALPTAPALPPDSPIDVRTFPTDCETPMGPCDACIVISVDVVGVPDTWGQVYTCTQFFDGQPYR